MLAKAGVILRFNGMVYLRPQEVAELVYKVRSCTLEAVRLRLMVHLMAVDRSSCCRLSPTEQPRTWLCHLLAFSCYLSQCDALPGSHAALCPMSAAAAAQ